MIKFFYCGFYIIRTSKMHIRRITSVYPWANWEIQDGCQDGRHHRIKPNFWTICPRISCNTSFSHIFCISSLFLALFLWLEVRYPRWLPYTGVKSNIKWKQIIVYDFIKSKRSIQWNILLFDFIRFFKQLSLFHPNLHNMTSLRLNFLKKFWTNFFQILSEDVELMP